MTKLPTKKEEPTLTAQVAALTKRVESLEQKVGYPRRSPDPDDEGEEEEAAAPRPRTAEEKAYFATLPEDGHFEPTPTGVTVKGRELDIDETAIPNWTIEEVTEVARLLNFDVRPWLGQPRELRRRVEKELERIGASSPDSVPEKVTERVAAKTSKMPGKLEKGDDGLPLTSPVEGKHPGEDALKGDDVTPVPPHLPRTAWKVKGKMLPLHLIAEEFRETVAVHKVWECEGYNCHDCVEVDKAIDSIASCAQYFEDDFQFKFPKGAGAELTASEWKSYVKKHEAKK